MELRTQTFEFRGIEFYVHMTFDDDEQSALAVIHTTNYKNNDAARSLIQEEELLNLLSEDEDFQVFARYARATIMANSLRGELLEVLYNKVFDGTNTKPIVQKAEYFKDYLFKKDDEAGVVIFVTHPFEIDNIVSILKDNYTVMAVKDYPGGVDVLITAPAEYAQQVMFENYYMTIRVVVKSLSESYVWN